MAGDLIAVVLAHPVSADVAAELQASDVRGYLAGQSIAVPRDRVMRLVNSGYVAGVDPGDEAAVRALLGLPALQLGPGRPVGALFTVTVPGALSPRAGTVRYYNDTGRMLAIRMVRASVGTPPQGGPIRIDVLKAGTSVFSTEAAQPTIPDGAAGAAAAPAEGRELLPAGAYVTVDVDAVGTIEPGADLHVAVTVEDVSAFIGQPGHTPPLRSGADAPAELFQDGDLYLRQNGDLYQQQSGAWVLAGNLRGPSGNAGITINGISGTTFTITPASIGAETPAGAQEKASAAQTAAAADSVPRDSTITAPPAGPLIRHARAFDVSAATPDVLQVITQGTVTGWLNEWGGYRGQPAYGWDAVVRMIAHATQTGNIAEYQNADRTHTLWGLNPDGYQLQGNGLAAPVKLAPLLVLATGAPVPDGTPAGTIIVRR